MASPNATLPQYSGVWSEWFWFPPDHGWGWKDLVNKPGTGIYYPEVWDLHWSLPLSLVLIVVRYIWELMVVVPIGLRLGLSNNKRKPVTSIPQLEASYKKKKRPDHATIEALSKQTDLTVRQVEIWFRKRVKQDALTPMQKFRECSWHLIFYTTFFIYGMMVVWDKPYTWKSILCWDGWPQQHVGNDIYWYYVVELSFYWSLIFTLCRDNKRKDFVEMTVHHVATIILMYFSWILNFVRVGTLVLVVHDSADTWLALTKMSIYIKKKMATDIFFVIFFLVWIVSRLIIYPYVLLYSTTVEPYMANIMAKTFGAHWFFNFFLYLLQVLHIIWSYLIFRIVYRKVVKGDFFKPVPLLRGYFTFSTPPRTYGSTIKALDKVLHCTLFEPFVHVLTSPFGAYVFFNLFLMLIFTLNLSWSYHILLVAYRSVCSRGDVEDVRSDSEEDDDEPSEDMDELGESKDTVQNGVNGKVTKAADLGDINGFTVGKTDGDKAKAEANGKKEEGVGNGDVQDGGKANGKQKSPSKIPKARKN